MRADVQFVFCAGEQYVVSWVDILGDAKESSFPTYPAQFTPIYNEINNIIGFAVYSAVEFPLQGNYDFTWGGDSYTFNAVFTNCQDTVEVCCNNQVNIKWVNQNGGIQNWIFTGVKTSEIQMGDSSTYMGLATQDRTGLDYITRAERFSTRGRCYRAYIVNADLIRKADVDALRSLRFAIQAWVVDDDAGLVPIIIDPDDVTEYTTRTKLFSVRLRFRTAIPVAIQ